MITIRHPHQARAFNDKARFKFLLVGRRGGKTYLIVEDMLKTISTAPFGAEIFYIGPTLQQAYELIWDALEDRMFELNWKFSPLISKRRFELSNKRRIYVIGAEKIRRIRGHKVYRVYLDEIAFMEQDLGAIWRAVRPALSDYKGGAVVATTPNGKGTQAYNFYLETLKKQDWKAFSWRTIDSPFIDPNEIEDAKREMDEKSFAQEYLAEWQSFEGLAYYNFNEAMHIKKTEPINTSAPVILSFDFNVNPTSILAVQEKVHNDLTLMQFKKEYSQKNSSTIDTVRSFCEDHKDLAGSIRIKVRGDSTGKSRTSVTGRSDYYYIEELLMNYGFNFQLEVLPKNPAIVDRVSVVNAYLKNVKGESRIEIDPSCTELIRDLSSQVLEGRFPSDKNNIGHKADACGYCVWFDYLMRQRKPQGTIQL